MIQTVSIIGFGNMGEAIIAGVCKQNAQVKVFVIEKNETRRLLATKKYAASCSPPANENDRINSAPSWNDSFCAADAVILAVKPQDIPHIAQEYGDLFSSMSAVPIISIAAGVSLQRLGELFPTSHIIRFMPSLAAQVGRAVTAISYSSNCTEGTRKTAFEIAGSIGMAIELAEELIPAIIGISGSAIAYVYEFIQALALGGVKEGLRYDASLEIALEVLEGAVVTLRQTATENLNPATLVTKVCSPGGTTIAGIQSLHNNHFTATVIEAVAVAAQRARELEQPLGRYPR